MVKRYFERKAYNSRRDQVYMGENEKKEFHFINEQIKKSRSTDVVVYAGGSGDCPGTYFRGWRRA